jgi:hypothetical protein
VPPYEFWHSPTESISWHLAQDPQLGEELVLGDRGVFRVIAKREPSPISDRPAYDVAFIRQATAKEIRDSAKALNNLRLSGGW